MLNMYCLHLILFPAWNFVKIFTDERIQCIVYTKYNTIYKWLWNHWQYEQRITWYVFYI